MIILDFETNTHNQYDVIEVAAVRIELNSEEFKMKEMFHRYYLSRFPVNFHSFNVHKLTPELILEYRNANKIKYPAYFKEDEEFAKFCEGANTLVAHNISFELRHCEKIVKFKNHFCTMKENKHIVKVLNKNGAIKNPKLDETCLFYGISFDPNAYHSATYDVSKCYEILKIMHQKKLIQKGKNEH